jgi:protein SCO1/2
MRCAALLTALLCLCAEAHAGEATPSLPTEPAAAPLSRATVGGRFRIDLSVQGATLKTGVNVLDLVVHDKDGKAVLGAEVAVTPWMPDRGQGVWDKPEVTERRAGSYHVENVKVITDGYWDLRVSVKSAAVEDLAIFSFTVGGKGPAQPAEKPKGYARTVKDYTIPDLTLIDQDGRRVKLRSFLLDPGKVVIIDFIYTTCTTICPVLSAGFSAIRRSLGDQAATRVQLVSLSIDPEHDRPEQMKEYLRRYGAGDEWDFLTGSREDIIKALTALDALVPDKMAHKPIYLLHGPKSEEWIRINGLIGGADLMRELKTLEGR